MRAAVAVLASLVLVAGCAASEPVAAGDSPSSQVSPPVPVPSGMAVELLQPIADLPSCPPPPDGVDERVPGLYLPAQATIVEVDADGPLTEVTGYVALTPVQLRAWFQTRDELEVIQVEDEVRESEALLYDGRYRLFVQALALCDQGSRFTAVVARGADADAVPTPRGSPAAGEQP